MKQITGFVRRLFRLHGSKSLWNYVTHTIFRIDYNSPILSLFQIEHMNFFFRFSVSSSSFFGLLIYRNTSFRRDVFLLVFVFRNSCKKIHSQRNVHEKSNMLTRKKIYAQKSADDILQARLFFTYNFVVLFFWIKLCIW